jgi:uncharacterized protein DUF6745
MVGRSQKSTRGARKAGVLAVPRPEAFRRIYMDIVGAPIPTRILAILCKLGGGQPVDQDARFGTLWRVDESGNVDREAILLLEVIDATPGRDGNQKRYWLRVPPSVTSARAAVAWTFDVPPERYMPEIET